jgi:HK97 family phage portal protein
MAWNSFLTQWFESQSLGLVEEKTEAPATEKRSYTLQDPYFWKYFNLGSTTLADVEVNWEAVLGTSPFYSAVRYISEGISMLDRTVKRRTKDGLEEATDHPMYDFFQRRPHPYYSWFDFFSALLTNACLGNGYAKIHWDEQTGRPMWFEHIPSMYVRPEFDESGALWYLISGSMNGKFSVFERLPYTDMIHIRGLSLDGINGLQTEWLHRDTHGVGIASTRYSAGVMGKGAFPSIAISIDQELDPTEVKNVEDNVMARIGGSNNAGRPLVIPKGQNVQYLQWSPLDVALEAVRTMNVEDVCRITKVPRDLLMLGAEGTYGAGVQRSLDFLTHCLGPWLEKTQDEIKTKAFFDSEQSEYLFEFDTSLYVSKDEAAESSMLAEGIRATQITPNEARKRKGLPPVEGGDDLMVDINLLPLKDALRIAFAKYLSAEGEKAVGGKSLGGEAEGKTDENGKKQPKPAPQQ